MDVCVCVCVCVPCYHLLCKMHATAGTRPAFELLSHGELAVSVVRVRTKYP